MFLAPKWLRAVSGVATLRLTAGLGPGRGARETKEGALSWRALVSLFGFET
jgi:hypothetical protein